MWSRITGKSNDVDDDSNTHSSRRKNGDSTSKRRRSGSTASSNLAHQKASKAENRDRGFTPISTSYASTTKNPYPNTASPSVALSYSAGVNNDQEHYIPPGLVRNASLADQMPKSKAGRDGHDQDQEGNRKGERRRERSLSRDRKQGERKRSRSRDLGDKHRERKGKRDQKDKDRVKDRGLSRSERGDGDDFGASRALGDFNQQVGSAGFMQFPGQYDGGFVGGPQDAAVSISSHVQDQFPGQFPAQSTEPYRPALAVSEGGPGLAAEYYGDAGQSVSDQPGVRLQSPSLIVGAEPHLQPASAVAAPPPEPSATGGIGAAASFFNGSFTPEPVEPPISSQFPAKANGTSLYHQDSSTHPSASDRPVPDTSHHSSSTPSIPTLSAAAAGAYHMIDGQSSQSQRPVHESLSSDIYGASSSTAQRPPSQLPSTLESINTHSTPSKPGKHSSQPSNIPIYAAGVAGLVGSALQNNHHSSAQSNLHSSVQNNHHSSAQHRPSVETGHNSTEPYQSSAQSYYTTSMAQQHRHHGPLSKFVDFFKDPEGVAQFEEYTEYIGVCRYCFVPGSSARDAPRKHHYRRRRSNEHLGSSTRVDKDSRYGSSDGEGRRRNKKSSLLSTGVAGYGLTKVGENLLNRKNDLGHTYSVKPGYPSSVHGARGNNSPDRSSITSRGVTQRSSGSKSRRRSRSKEWTENGFSRRSSDAHSRVRSRSKERVEGGVTRKGGDHKREPQGGFLGGSTTTVHASRHQARARSRSRSRNRKSAVSGAVLGAAVSSSLATVSSRPRSRSPKKTLVRSEQRSQDRSPELPAILRVSRPEHHHENHRLPNSSPPSRLYKSRRKERKGGFFSFGNHSSSSSDAGGFRSSGREKRPGSKTSKARDKDPRDTDMAIMGLGAAATALALNQSRHGGKPTRIGDLVGVNESRGKHGHASHRNRKHTKSANSGSEDNSWVSASETETASGDSALAYGMPARRNRSQESLSSESSGMGLWGWRWGSKKNKKDFKKVKRQTNSSKVDTVAASPAMALLGDANKISSIPVDQHHDIRVGSATSVPLQLVHPVPTSDPSRFDIASANSVASAGDPIMYSRPGPVPIQHPQPIAPVSPAVYSAQHPYVHSYSAPTGPPVYYHNPYQPQPSSANNQHEASFTKTQDAIPGGFPSTYRLPETAIMGEVKPRRRDTSPNAPSIEKISKTASPRQRSSLKDESSVVRFDLGKDQQDHNVGEKRREKKQDEDVQFQRERREARRQKEGEAVRTQSERRERRRSAKGEELRIESKKQEVAESKKDDGNQRAPRDKSSKDSSSNEGKQRSAPATTAIIAAAAGVVAAVESSRRNVEQLERREVKQRDTESRQDETASRGHHKPPEDLSEQMHSSERSNSPPQRKRVTSVPRATSKVRASDFVHEDYASFFAPAELSHSSQEPNTHDANTSADNEVTIHQTPEFVVREPAGLHSSSRSPSYSYPPDELGSDQIFPSWVPSLNLIEPTPPASRASSIRGPPSPAIHPLQDVSKEQEEQTPKSNTSSKVTWGEPETREYVVVTPMEARDQFIDSSELVTNSDEDALKPQAQAIRKTGGESPTTNGSQAKHEPGYYGNDLEFAATLAAGLEDTGFNPSIVVDDEIFRRRNSPPGSEKVGIAEEVSRRRRESPKGGVEDLPRSVMPGSFDDDEEFDFKLSKKERKKREKAAKRHGIADTSRDRDVDEASWSQKPASVEHAPLGYNEADAFHEYDDHNGNKNTRSVGSEQDGAGEPNTAATPSSQNASTEESFFDPVVPKSDTSRSRAIQREVAEALLEDARHEITDRRISSGTLKDGNDNGKITKDTDIKPTRDLYESPTEDALSIAATVSVNTETSHGKKHRKKSNRNNTGYDDAASVASSPVAFEENRASKKPTKKEEQKGGIFGLFRKSTDSSLEANRNIDAPEEATFEDFEEPKRKGKSSKDRKSVLNDEVSSTQIGNPGGLDDEEDKGRSHKARDKKQNRRSSGGGTAQDSGRITQDLPAKVYIPSFHGHSWIPGKVG